ncbi:hypothetical protein BDQ17DRAFT_1337123 [Cyathus striatus]|nr:hypothetical protein BDQ17DRAFT_1337123 [Cyathus striatus]
MAMNGYVSVIFYPVVEGHHAIQNLFSLELEKTYIKTIGSAEQKNTNWAIFPVDWRFATHTRTRNSNANSCPMRAREVQWHDVFLESVNRCSAVPVAAWRKLLKSGSTDVALELGRDVNCPRFTYWDNNENFLAEVRTKYPNNMKIEGLSSSITDVHSNMGNVRAASSAQVDNLELFRVSVAAIAHSICGQASIERENMLLLLWSSIIIRYG